MIKFYVICTIALFLNGVLCQEDSDSDDELEDRYGLRRQTPRQWFPGQDWNPGQWQNPGQGQIPSQWPNPFPGQGQNPGQWQNPFLGQGQNPGQGPNNGQGQNPGQWQNPLPGQGQNPIPWQNPSTGQGQNPLQGQNPIPWQNPLTGQGQNQFPGQNQLPGQINNQGASGSPGQVNLPGLDQIFGSPWQNRTTGSTNDGQSTTPPATTGTATTISPAVRQCIASCPVTSEYNPVCGTNNVTYSNQGRLICAQSCGTNVSLLRTSPCPTMPVTVDGVSPL